MGRDGARARGGTEVREDVMAFPEALLMRHVDVSKARLRSWIDQDLVAPRVQERRGRRIVLQYSLQEAMRAVVVARLQALGVPIGRIRNAVAELSRDGVRSPLTSIAWGAEEGHLYFEREPGEWSDGNRPAQYVIREALIDLRQVRASLVSLQAREDDDAGHVAVRRGLMGSQPVLRGTRVPVATVREWLDAGFEPQKILAAYPTLTLADVEAVAGAAARS